MGKPRIAKSPRLPQGQGVIDGIILDKRKSPPQRRKTTCGNGFMIAVGQSPRAKARGQKKRKAGNDPGLSQGAVFF
jgi:hypothetical protein